MAKINKTRFALLGFLSMGPNSGYDIKKYMERTTSHFWREGDSSIYPILKQLLKEEMVTCALTNTESDKPKKVYTITNAGQQELEQWLLETPEIPHSRNEMMLKVFFGWNVEREVILSHLEKYRNIVNARLKQYKFWEKTVPAPKAIKNDRLHRYLTLRAGVISAEATLKWCDEALELLKNESN